MKLAKKQVIIIFVLLLLALTLPLPLFLVSQRQEIRKEVEEGSIPREILVLDLRYFPPDPSNPEKLNKNIVGEDLPGEVYIRDVRNRVETIENELIYNLERGSAYHQYKDNNSRPVLRYRILEKKEFLRPILRTDNPEWNFNPDHLNELRSLNICDYVERKGVKEVWIWMYHYTPDLNGDGRPDKDPNRYFVGPVESNMAGPFGDISNSERFNDDLPVCSKTYTVYEYNYGRWIGEALEDHGHQIEAVFSYVDSDIWGRFVGGSTEPFACGNVHCPPNVMFDCPNHQYDWHNERKVLSYCEDWKPEGGETKEVNCHTWAKGNCVVDGEIGYKVWWMQNIPQNWWVYFSDFDWAMTVRWGLRHPSIPFPSPTPLLTPTFSSTPSPVPTLACAGDGDLNLDGRVSEIDIMIVLINWSPNGPVPTPRTGYCSADLT